MLRPRARRRSSWRRCCRAKTQLALMYNLALLTAVNYKLPKDENLEATARATLNTCRMVNFALQPLRMPASLIGTGTRMRNPLGGFVYPETVLGCRLDNPRVIPHGTPS